jgi:hypothetical protein
MQELFPFCHPERSRGISRYSCFRELLRPPYGSFPEQNQDASDNRQKVEQEDGWTQIQAEP